MKEPELKVEHLVVYLPYKLKIQFVNNYYDSATGGAYNKNEIYEMTLRLIADLKPFISEPRFKPILYPLSDLTKPKFPDGSKNSNPTWWKLKIQVGILDSLDYNTVQELLEKHYDLFGLIEKNLAISVHELPENPYK